MVERLKAHAWKACVPKGTAGSNPVLSAKQKYSIIAVFFCLFIYNHLCLNIANT